MAVTVIAGAVILGATWWSMRDAVDRLDAMRGGA
jgi:hypothetical protein